MSPPATTMMGALLTYITGAAPKTFQPINANFGLLPPLRSLVRDTLAPGPIARAGWLSVSAVQELLHDHETGRADHAWRVWSLLVLQRWLERWASPRVPARAQSVQPSEAA